MSPMTQTSKDHSQVVETGVAVSGLREKNRIHERVAKAPPPGGP